MEFWLTCQFCDCVFCVTSEEEVINDTTLCPCCGKINDGVFLRNREHLGYAAGRVEARKQVFQYIAPERTDMDIDISSLVGSMSELSVEYGNYYYEDTVGAATIAFNLSNRSNYIVLESFPSEDRYEVVVPNGAPPETKNEKEKRVFELKPAYWHKTGDFVYPWEGKPNNYKGPIVREGVPSIDVDTNGNEIAPVSWVYQTQSDRNVECVLVQKYGNFTNESFWIDVAKFKSGVPDEFLPKTEEQLAKEAEERRKKNEEMLEEWEENNKINEQEADPQDIYAEFSGSVPTEQEYSDASDESDDMVSGGIPSATPNGDENGRDEDDFDGDNQDATDMADTLDGGGGAESERDTFQRDDSFRPKLIWYGSGLQDVDAYFAIRIGWQTEDGIDSQNNSNNILPGPYDIVFPVGQPPFIFDNFFNNDLDDSLEDQDGDPDSGPRREGEDPENATSSGGESEEEELEREMAEGELEEEQGEIKKQESPIKRDGLVVSINRDPSWILPEGKISFRLSFLVLRGKLIIRSSFSNSAWVFPQELTRVAMNFKERYANFFMPPGKVAILSAGHSFMFNFNPMEFNLYLQGQRITPAGLIPLVPVLDRTEFPVDGTFGWGDIDGKIGKESVYTRIPYAIATHSPENDASNPTDKKYYGFDYVIEEYPGHKGSYTSMMIPIDDSSVKRYVDVVLKDPSDQNNMTKEVRHDLHLASAVSYARDGVLTTKMAEAHLNPGSPCYLPNSPSGINFYTDDISDRFASPVFWRTKMVYKMPDVKQEPWLDITKLVKSFTVSSSTSDLLIITQSANIDLYVPKDYQLNEDGEDHFGLQYMSGGKIKTRQDFINFLHGGGIEVRIWSGWKHGKALDLAVQDIDFMSKYKDGDFTMLFTGILQKPSFNQQYDADIMTLQCTDLMEILNGYKIINSPIYDGMSVENAFWHICQLGGLPKSLFDVISDFAYRSVLPISATFLNPAVRFEPGTVLFDAVKQIAQYQLYTLRCEPDGTIVLTDIYSDMIQKYQYQHETVPYLGTMVLVDQLEPTHPSYTFFVDGYRAAQNVGQAAPFQRAYESINYTKNVDEMHNSFQLVTIDRRSGATLYGEVLDYPSVEDPEYENFLGYVKTMRYQQPALGEIEQINYFMQEWPKFALKSPVDVDFSTYGRPTIRPLDIIMVEHQHDLIGVKAGVDTEDYYGGSKKLLKYRVVNVEHRFDIEGDKTFAFKTHIQGKHI